MRGRFGMLRKDGLEGTGTGDISRADGDGKRVITATAGGG